MSSSSTLDNSKTEAPSAGESSASQEPSLEEKGSKSEAQTAVEAASSDDSGKDQSTYWIKVRSPSGSSVPLQVSSLDTVQDVRQCLFEAPETSDLTSYTLQFEGKSVNDYAELHEIKNLGPDSVLVMSPAPYNKRTSLLHIRRLREILGFHLGHFANTPSPSLFSHFCPTEAEEDHQREEEEQQQQQQHQDKERGSKEKEKNQKKGGASNDGNKKAVEAKKKQKQTTRSSSSEEESPIDLQPASLEAFYPQLNTNEQPCVKSIEFAGWNPPPGSRALLGDLCYLQVTTLEGQTVFITSWARGFYVNSCTESAFNPRPAASPCSSHSLAGTLSQLSPQFKKNFHRLLKTSHSGRHPFELMVVPIPLTPWVGMEVPHVYDKNRAEYAILYTEMDFAGNMRDWNEEYQACKELPSKTIQERITRDRAIAKVNNDFVDSAMRGAMAIVNQAVPSINPQEEPRFQLFIYNNTFFSFCFDHRDPDFKPLEPPVAKAGEEVADKDKYTEQATYVSANNDLKGIRLYNDADVAGLGTVLTAIIDYRGYRLLAQSLIPGVLQREETNLAYGSMNNGETVHAEPEFHELMRKVALQMHIKETKITDSSGNTVQLACPINAKGIVGTDGRRYLIDLGKAFPTDINWASSSHEQPENRSEQGKGLVLHPSSQPLMRPELVTLFCDALELRLQQQEGDDLKVTITEEAGEEGTKKTVIDLSSAVLVHAEEQEEEAAEEKKKSDEASVEAQSQEIAQAGEPKPQEEDGSTAAVKKGRKRYTITINPNVLQATSSNFELCAPKEEIEKDEALVKRLSSFLQDSILPRMADEFVRLFSTPVDGQTLTSIMHRNGVNMRYLGQLTNLCKGRPFLLRLCEQEMVVRVAKHELNRYLREIEDHLLSLAISHFLNCLFGDTEALSGGVDLHALDETVTTHKSVPDRHGPANHSSGTNHASVGRKKNNSSSSNNKNKKKKKNQSKPEEGAPQPSSKLVDLPSSATIFSLTSESLWQKLQELVRTHFRYEISLQGGAAIPKNPWEQTEADEATLNTRQRLRSLAAVRSFSQKVGIQVEAQNYELSSNTPFKRRSVLDVFPLVKHVQPKSRDGQQLLDAGKVFLAQGRLDIAFELFNEALAIFHQVYGPLHPDTALCYGNLAMVHYHANDTAQALVHQQKMVIINERVHGLDHHDTAHSYGNLALFIRDLKKESMIPVALKCLKRAHFLASLVCGPHHPDSPNTLMHLGTMYQDLGNAEVALKYFQEALKSNKYFSGNEENLQTGQIYHCIALAYSSLDQFKQALDWEKKHYTILSNLFGEKDFRTTESNIWLKQFTRKAVQMQIEAKKAQRDITSNLSQEKLEKLTRQAGAVRAAGGRGKKFSSLPPTAQTKPAFKI